MEKKKVVKVDRWIVNHSNKLVSGNGKLMMIPFDKIYNMDDRFNAFILSKDIYITRLPIITGYMNYFIEFYDKEDNELLTAILKLRYMIANKSIKLTEKAFIDAIYKIMFTDSMVEKIMRMTEDNYMIDLTPKGNKKYKESMEFTNEHAKVLMSISTGIKFIIPIVSHYNKSIGINKPDYYKYYEPMLYRIPHEGDIYTKLYYNVKKKVDHNYTRNKTSWNQREIFGTDTSLYMDKLFKDTIVAEGMFEYIFSKNIHNFNTVRMDKQLGFNMKTKYDHNLRSINKSKDVEGLSSMDRFEMSLNKTDEALVILSAINVRNTIEKIKKKFSIEITREEILFYLKYHTISEFQEDMVRSFFADYFKGFKDLDLLDRKIYMELLIILKKKLLADGQIYFPQVLSGNVENKLTMRVIQDKKIISKIEESETYRELRDNKYSALNDLFGEDEDPILKVISVFTNSKFTYVYYAMPDMLGKPIVPNVYLLADEILKFLKQI